MGNHGNQFITFLDNSGIPLETTPTDSTDFGTGNSNAIFLFRLTGAVAGKKYDQIKMDLGTIAGNIRVGIYDSVTDTPVNLLSESASAVAVTGYTTQIPITEFTVTTTTMWLSVNCSASGLHYLGDVTSDRYFKAQAFGAFPNPIVTPTAQFGSGAFRGTLSHS